MFTIWAIMMLILVLFFLYQCFRAIEIIKIRKIWLKNNDPRLLFYDSNDMFNQSKDNWFGLKWPTDKHYK